MNKSQQMRYCEMASIYVILRSPVFRLPLGSTRVPCHLHQHTSGAQFVQ
jgi:hypothetical protein